jgi:hypothetical protein
VITIAILNSVFAALAIGILVAVKLAGYHVAGKEHEQVLLIPADEERLAA